jgi:hypothetical protein
MVLTDLIVEFEEKGEERRKIVLEEFKKGDTLKPGQILRANSFNDALASGSIFFQQQQMQQMQQNFFAQTGTFQQQQGLGGTLSSGLYNIWGGDSRL